MEKESKLSEISPVNADILSILQIADHISWNGVRKYSIYRIIYLSSVLYTFIHTETKSNPFADDYNFFPDLRGPFSEKIKESINFLVANQYIEKFEKEEKYKPGKNPIPNIDMLPSYGDRKEWLSAVIHILGIYGEEKIYDFVFRDPEYKTNIQEYSQKGLNLKSTNETIGWLNSFKEAFEETIGKEAEKIDNKKYLRLYFDYVFSKIIKSEE